MKKCRICNETKELSLFAKRSKDKLHTFCRECDNKKRKEKYNSKKEAERYLRKKEKYGDRIREQNREAKKRYVKRHRDKVRAMWRSYYHKKKASGELKREYEKEKAVSASTAWRKRNYKKFMAAHYLRKAVKKGEIIKSKYCQICGKETKLEGHHFDYDKPLSVIWVCRSCHCVMDRQRRLMEEAE